MRVAFVAARTPFHGESERAARLQTLAEDLAARRNRVRFFCAGWWEGDHERFDHEGVTYRALAPAPGSDRFPVRLPGALAAFDPDLVHAAHDRPEAVLAARAGAAAARAPLVVDWYDATGYQPSGRIRSRVADRLRRRAARAPARVVTPSRLVQTGVRELGVPESRTAVIPTGVDFDLVRGVEPEERGEVVYSRRLDGDANLESLLLALAEFRTRGWRAVVIGDGPERESYERQARDLRIGDRVEFLGEQPLERRLALFRGGHVYVHTALRTPFAADLARALACGCVGVAEYQADSAAHELVERRSRGLLATDDGELVECLAAAADMEHREGDDSVDDLGTDAVRRRYLGLYEELR